MPLGFVRIVKTPAGEAPEEVREQWVGLILPCPEGEEPTHSIGHGVMSGAVSERLGYTVPAVIAIDILAMKDPRAANWWVSCTPYYTATAEFTFRAEECEVVR
jgi:hypothetical protein